MGKLLVLLVICLLLFMGATVAAYQAFGVWGLLGLVVLFFVGLAVLKRIIGHALKNALVTPFKMKGAVLKGATVELHGIVSAPLPDRTQVRDESEDGEDDESVMTTSNLPL